VNVDISGADSAAFIKENVFSKVRCCSSSLPSPADISSQLNIFDEAEQAQYSIYRTEIGAFAIGQSLRDDQLLELCQHYGDDKGSLKLLVSHMQAPVHDMSSPPPLSATLAGPSPSLLPPVVIPQYNCTPARPPRSHSRQDSLSSASEHRQELSAGYEADVDNTEKDAHKSGTRKLPSQNLLSATPVGPSPPSPRGARRALPLPIPPQPNTPVQHPTSPPLQSSSSAPIGIENTTIYDKYGRVVPAPPPPPPLSPDRATFALDDGSTSVPSRYGHMRIGSDAMAERDDSVQYVGSPPRNWNEPSRSIGQFKLDPFKDRKYHNRSIRNDYEDRDKSDWVIVERGSEDMQSDPPRNSPLSARNQQIVSPSQYKSNVRSIQIPAPPRNPPPAVPVASPDSSRASSRQNAQQVPPNWAVSWKGEGGINQRPQPANNWRRGLGSGAKSMDNLRATFHNLPPILQPGGSRRSPVQAPINQRPTPPTRDWETPNVQKTQEHRHIRPLPVAGPSQSGESSAKRSPPLPPAGSGYTSPEPYPRPASAIDNLSDSPVARPTRPVAGSVNSEMQDASRSARGLSPLRRVQGAMGMMSSRSIASFGTSTTAGSPPRSPVTSRLAVQDKLDGRPPGDPDDGTVKQEDHARFAQMLKENDSTFMPQSFKGYDDSDSEGEESGTSIWKKPPKLDSPSMIQRPPLTVHIEGSSTPNSRSTSKTSSMAHGLTGGLFPNRRPRSPEAPKRTPSQKARVRASTFTDREETWAPRPPPEDVYDRLEEFFPEHDLDKPVVEASSGGTSPVTSEPIPPPPTPMTSGTEKPLDRTIDKLKVKAKKSIRVVAEEQKRRIDRTSKADVSAMNANMNRKRSTKLWGSKVEEVTTVQAKGLVPSLPETPSNSPSTSINIISSVPSAEDIPGTFKWVRGELIGRGTYGKVYLALNVTTGEMIAVKQVEIPRTASDKNDSRQVSVVQALKLESETLKDLDHPHIVQYLGFEETPTNLSMYVFF
jgi:hypothetical protein